MKAIASLPEGWGAAWLCEPGEHHARDAASARSYDHLGRQLAWVPASGLEASAVACDLECDTPHLAPTAERFGLPPREFARRWVATEVLAKLFDTPILAWLKQHGLADPERASDGGVRVLVTEQRTLGVFAAFGVRVAAGAPRVEVPISS